MDAARETARQLHGELTLQNTPGKGTRIHLQIPSNTEEILTPSSISI